MANLLAIRGPLTGARIELRDEETVLGRAPESTIALHDSTVSRTHAIVRRKRLGWVVEDAHSSTGTILNGRAIKEPEPLSPNDEIRVGHSIFLFDSNFDLQNADFTDNSVFFSSPHDETMELEPVATLEGERKKEEAPASHEGMEFLVELGELFDSTRIPMGEALKSSLTRMAGLLSAEVALLMLYDTGAQQLRLSAAVGPGEILADYSVLNRVFQDRKALLLSDKPRLQSHPAPNAPKTRGSRSVVGAPLLVDGNCLGVLYFERQELDSYTLKDLRAAQSLAKLMAIFVEARQRAHAASLRSNMADPESIVLGGSPAFRKTMEFVRRVAPAPVAVLLTGETGSGKEVVAREIHRLSTEGKGERPFIAVNCAAIPETLFESELFGYERGAFTGAYRMRQGLIEEAQGGTLFLDEIGDMIPSVQPKLLRFLQEGTFMRVGGTKLHRAQVRLITATNHPLEEEVKAGRFREDLYHRLSVFPIRVPALRERREDIRPLADYFCQKFARSMRRDILGISEEALVQLEKYSWPGNVRELANCLERAVLLSDDKILLPRHFMLGGQGASPAFPRSPSPASWRDSKQAADDTFVLRKLEDVEREHILKVMKEVDNNQVKAAELLGIHRNTLRKKLQEYGVRS